MEEVEEEVVVVQLVGVVVAAVVAGEERLVEAVDQAKKSTEMKWVEGVVEVHLMAGLVERQAVAKAGWRTRGHACQRSEGHRGQE